MVCDLSQYETVYQPDNHGIFHRPMLLLPELPFLFERTSPAASERTLVV